jgi:hypothetical protein
MTKIKNWEKFQHFKDRRPPWVKLYRDLLDDIEWHELDPVCAKVLVMLWLIASEDEGRVPEIKKLAFRLRMTETEVKRILSKLSHWLDHDDINAISSEYQDDAPETETEKRQSKRQTATAVARPQSVSQQVWEDWLVVRKKKDQPLTATAWEQTLKEIEKSGHTAEEVIRECCLRGWAGFRSSWLKENPITAAAGASKFAGDI